MKVNPNSAAIQNTGMSDVQSGKKTERTKTEAYTNRSPEGASVQNTGSAKTEISARAKEMATAKKVASDTPDVREAKIAALKEQIANKKYNVGADAIADRLVDDHLRMGGA